MYADMYNIHPGTDLYSLNIHYIHSILYIFMENYLFAPNSQGNYCNVCQLTMNIIQCIIHTSNQKTFVKEFYL